MIISLILIASVGFMVSLYGYFVENTLKKDSTYQPACDISDKISCSKVIHSEYGKMFAFSNTILGMIYYASMIACAFFKYTYFAFFLASASICVSLIFAYILFFKIKSFCPICVSVYVVNIALLITTYYNL